MSASLSLIDFPNPSYLSPSFEVRRVEVYLHLSGLVERRRIEPLQIVEEHRERVFNLSSLPQSCDKTRNCD